MEATTGTALGSLLRFSGMVCCRFDAEIHEETPPFASVIGLFPQWTAMTEAGGLALPLAELECAVNALSCADARTAALHEYQRLFLSPELPVPLWESVWLSREKLLFTEETSRVRQWYSTYGLEIHHAGTEAEDHLGLELFFCGWLYDLACRKTDVASEGFAAPLPTLETVDAFMDEHLGRWGGSCLDKLAAEAKTPFWKNLFGVTRPLLS